MSRRLTLVLAVLLVGAAAGVIVAATARARVYLNGKPVASDVVVQNGVPYVPATLVGRATGLAVEWDAKSRVLYLGGRPGARRSVTIGDPDNWDEVAGLTYGSTVERARKLFGPEDQRDGDSASVFRTWYPQKGLRLRVDTGDLDTVRSVVLVRQEGGPDVTTAGRVVLGRDTLSDLERKLGADYDLREGLWGAEAWYTVEVVHYVGGEGSLALAFGSELASPDRVPPGDYGRWLDKIGAAIKKRDRREFKRLLGKRTPYLVELEPS